MQVYKVDNVSKLLFSFHIHPAEVFNSKIKAFRETNSKLTVHHKYVQAYYALIRLFNYHLHSFSSIAVFQWFVNYISLQKKQAVTHSFQSSWSSQIVSFCDENPRNEREEETNVEQKNSEMKETKQEEERLTKKSFSYPLLEERRTLTKPKK